MKKLIIASSLALATSFAHAGQQSCYIMGDSIANGIATFATCPSSTQIGINTKAAKAKFVSIPAADLVVISLGVNDRGTYRQEVTTANLAQIRSRVHAKHVVWILPHPAMYQKLVQDTASHYGDATLNVDKYVSSDGIHPTYPAGYQSIAKTIFNNKI